MALSALIAFLAGALLPLQAAANSRLGKDLGHPGLSALASFLVGLTGLALYLAVMRVKLPSPEQLAVPPAAAWIGGLLGAAYVTMVVVLTPKLGVAVTMGVSMVGQLVIAAVIDHYGLLGVPQQSATAMRWLGIAMMVAGLVVVMRSVPEVSATQTGS